MKQENLIYFLDSATFKEVKANILLYCDKKGKIPTIQQYNRTFSDKLINYFLIENDISYSYLINDVLELVKTTKGVIGKPIYIKALKKEVDSFFRCNGKLPNMEQLEKLSKINCSEDDDVLMKEVLGGNLNKIYTQLGYNVPKKSNKPSIKRVTFNTVEDYCKALPSLISEEDGLFQNFLPKQNIVVKVLNKKEKKVCA
ncbi:MAG: hypothetical protein K0R54_605 [Clostridiaceae bacterium]|jgi:hypothetical protein|nr:hypothetical protein [Clostridiaceae bacterium]